MLVHLWVGSAEPRALQLLGHACVSYSTTTLS